LLVVRLTEDMAAGLALVLIEPPALPEIEPTAIGAVDSFLLADPGLLGPQSRGFGPRQFSASNTLPDPRLLPMFDPVDRRSSVLCKCRNRCG